MRNLLKVYCQYLPAETESKAIQNNLVAYLLVTEIHSELSKTLFYKVFPCLLHPPTGVNLEVLSGSLRRHLLFLQDNPAYLQVRPHLVRPAVSSDVKVFGDSLFFDVSRSRSTDVYAMYLDQLVRRRLFRTLMSSGTASGSHGDPFGRRESPGPVFDGRHEREECVGEEHGSAVHSEPVLLDCECACGGRDGELCVVRQSKFSQGTAEERFSALDPVARCS